MAVAPRRILTALIAAVTLVAVILAAGDLGDLGDRLGGYSWWTFGVACALALGNYALRFVRWSLYLRRLDVEVPTRSSLVVFLAGFALAITPGKVGELVKSYLLRALHGVPITRTAPIVVAERLSDLVSLTVVAAIGVAAYQVATEAVVAGAAVLVIGLVILSSPRLCRATVDALTHLRRLRPFRARAHELYDGIATLVRPTPMVWSTGLGVASWSCECIAFAVVLGGFPGTDVALGLSTLIFAATLIAGALSFLPGGLGVTEGAMTLLLVQSGGVDNATAVAATVLIRFATFWLSVGIGLVALAIARRMTAAAVDREAILSA